MQNQLLLKNASIDVGSNTGKFPRLARSKRLPNVGYKPTAAPQTLQIETCPCLVEKGPSSALVVTQGFSS